MKQSEKMWNVMRKKTITFMCALVCLFTMTTAAGCAREMKADGNTAQSGSGMQEEDITQDGTYKGELIVL